MWALLLLIIILILLKWIFGSIILGFVITVCISILIYFRKEIWEFLCNTYRFINSLSMRTRILCCIGIAVLVGGVYLCNYIADYIEEKEAEEGRRMLAEKMAIQQRNEQRIKDSIQIAREKEWKLSKERDSIDRVTRKDYYDSIANVEDRIKAERKRKKLETKRKTEQFLNHKVKIYKDVFYGMTRKAFHNSAIYNDKFYGYGFDKVLDESFSNDRLISFTLLYHVSVSKVYGKNEWHNPTESIQYQKIKSWLYSNFMNSDFSLNTFYEHKGGWREEDKIYGLRVTVRPKSSLGLDFDLLD